MPIEFKKNLVVCREHIGVEEAEVLLSWLQKHRTAQIDLASCCYLHPASLQVLMAAAPRVKAWPEQAELRRWLQSAITLSQTDKR